MNPKILSLLVIVAFCVFCLTGCSRLMRFRYLEAQVNNTGWLPLSEKDIGSYKYEHESVTVILCCEGRGTQGLSFGPVFLPVVPFPTPTPGFESEWKFSMRVGIDSLKTASAIDLSKIMIELSGGRILPVAKASAFKAVGESPNYCAFKAQDERARNEVEIGLFQVSKDRISLILEFDVLARDVREFILDLGDLSLGGENLKLPPLKYNMGSKYYYDPFIIPQPS